MDAIGKCTFCDISLDYIKIYEPVAASLLCDRMEQMMEQTGENGFHYVDEAAPPALMRHWHSILQEKIISDLVDKHSIRKKFSRDLCLLLKASAVLRFRSQYQIVC
jgi:hypothetical protein